MCWTGGGEQEGLTGNLFLVGPNTVWRDEEDERKKKNCKQMVEVQARKRRNKIDSGRGRRERNNTLSGENLGRRPAGVKGEKKKCLHCCFYYLAAVILLYL